MLCQLVCTDRRYARMNCFNIRELQGILKRKFFVDLINTHDHRDLTNQTMLSLRFKLNNNINLEHDVLSFYNYGVHSENSNKFFGFNNFKIENNSFIERNTLTNSNFYFLNNKNNFNIFKVEDIYNILLNFNLIFINIFSIFSSFNLSSIYFNNFLLPFFNIILKTLKNNFNFYISTNILYSRVNNPETNLNNNKYILNSEFSINNSIYSNFTENSDSQRFLRFNNALINYDYKTGHYVGD